MHRRSLTYLGGRRVRLWRSVETGEGAPSVRKNIYLYYFSCRISRVLENWRSEFPNFLHAAPYGNSKDTLLPRFAKILLCVDLWGKWGAKMVKNTIFDKNLLLTLFWLRKWGILTRNGWKETVWGAQIKKFEKKFSSQKFEFFQKLQQKWCFFCN